MSVNSTSRAAPAAVGSTTVKATVVGETKGDKVTVFKMKPKKRYRKKTGHRQRLTTLKIDNIGG